MNKKKIFNDPIYGFISVPFEIILDIIDHPYVQRLRRIRQLGLTHLVYPGALHTRFHHALGSMHLMTQAIETIRSKGHEITQPEAEAVTIAILLHDVGHGPFSHALEHSVVEGIHHEEVSLMIMDRLNQHFEGKLSMAISIFKDDYPKKFLHQLVSSQLDMDRLDYLNRDSFYTGVSEGVVSSDRIIKMLEVVNDQLVIEEKSIYSIEKFIIARRLMYWQVYLHKTVLAAEMLLVKILLRARQLAMAGHELFTTPALREFLYHQHTRSDFNAQPELLLRFCELDDYDIFTSIKVWVHHDDKILSRLCMGMVHRKLYKIKISKQPISQLVVDEYTTCAQSVFETNAEDASYFVFTGDIENNAYNPAHDKINILSKDGTLIDISQASDQLNIQALEGVVKKFYLCYPAECIPL